MNKNYHWLDHSVQIRPDRKPAWTTRSTYTPPSGRCWRSCCRTAPPRGRPSLSSTWRTSSPGQCCRPGGCGKVRPGSTPSRGRLRRRRRRRPPRGGRGVSRVLREWKLNILHSMPRQNSNCAGEAGSLSGNPLRSPVSTIRTICRSVSGSAGKNVFTANKVCSDCWPPLQKLSHFRTRQQS